MLDRQPLLVHHPNGPPRRRHPRHIAPAVRYPLALPRVIVQATTLCMISGVLGLLIWSWQGAGTGMDTLGLGAHALVWLASAALMGSAYIELRQHPRGTLRFDQGRWRWQPALSTRLSTPLNAQSSVQPCVELDAPYVPIDFQTLILVRFDRPQPASRRTWWRPRRVVYLWLERRAAPEHWPALRRALFDRHITQPSPHLL